MFDNTKQKVDFAYSAAQSYIDNFCRDDMVKEMKEKYSNIPTEVFEMVWRCIDAYEDTRIQ